MKNSICQENLFLGIGVEPKGPDPKIGCGCIGVLRPDLGHKFAVPEE